MTIRRVLGSVAAVSASLTFALAPAAQADFDAVADDFLAPFLDATTGNLDWDALVSPTAWDDFLAPAHWDAALAELAGPALAGPALADPTVLVQQYLYTPIHTGIEDWINSDLGQQLNNLINQPFLALTGRALIGDGADGTAEHTAGGDGGWLFGDGGHGWNGTASGVAGGHGGAAGIFGTGGVGGDGGAGAAGGAGGAGGSLIGVGGEGGHGGADGRGGDGGSATGLFGIGGRGGDAGDGVYSGGHHLPALGGAGGNGSMLLGAHGDHGHYGTLDGAPPSGVADLGTAGGWITAGDGRAVILHGFSEVNKTPPFTPSSVGFSDDDAAYLAANGFNVVRLGILWAGVEPEPGVIDYNYLSDIAQTVQTLANHGVRTVLDMHQDLYSISLGADGAPEWAVQTGGLPDLNTGFPWTYATSAAQNHAWDAFWTNSPAPDGIGLQNHYAQMWEHVAGYFKDDPSVVGYELMNEPWPGSTWLSSIFGNSFFEGQQLTPFYNQVDAAIRAVDPATTVYFEPSTLSGNLPIPTHLGTVDDPNSVFAFHDYCTSIALLGTDFGCSLWETVVQGNAEAYASSHGIPVSITEFGASTNLAANTETMTEANRYGYNWMFWDYTLLRNWDLHQPPVGDNVDTATMTSLAQPYPQLVGGTPGSWSFDNGTFEFSYSTAMAGGGGSFAAGTQTEISVPALQYPDGYHVTVTGGHVISMAGAPVLVIASDSGATTVNVVVTTAS